MESSFSSLDSSNSKRKFPLPSALHKPLPPIPESLNQNRSSRELSYTEKGNKKMEVHSDSSVLNRLELEDVEDRFSRIQYMGEDFLEVIDKELVDYFKSKQLDGNINNKVDTTKNFIYVGKGDRLYRKPLAGRIQDTSNVLGADSVKMSTSILDDVVKNATNSSRSPLLESLDETSSILTGTKRKVLYPSNSYSEIMAGKKSESEDESDNEQFSWVEFGKVNTKSNKGEIKFLSLKDLENIEENISTLKNSEFQKLKEQYEQAIATLQVSENQFLISKNALEKAIQENNIEFIRGHKSLRDSIENQKKRLKQLTTKIKDLVSKKSPYFPSEIKMPRLGKKDSFNAEQIKLFPTVGSNEDISIKDLFLVLSEWAENEGLSEKGLKRAIFCRLRGGRAKSWLRYKDLPLKDAILSMINLHDRSESVMKYASQIKSFARQSGEDIQNSVERLLVSINKYLENKTVEEQKILRKEILISKLSGLLSQRGYLELERKMEEKRQIGSELSEKEILSLVYTEHIFDQRSNDQKSYLQINNVEKLESREENPIDDITQQLSELELNAIEHKRRIDSYKGHEGHDFKQAKTATNPRLDSDRKILSASRQYGTTPNSNSENISRIGNNRNSKPIMVGRDGQGYVKVGNPNPNNKWHNRNTRDSYDHSRIQDQFRNQDRKEFIRSRNSPLLQNSLDDNNQRYRFEGRYDRNTQNNFRSDNQFSRQRRNSYPNNPNVRNQGNYGYRDLRRNNFGNRGSYTSNGGGLRHNMQIKSNPPAIFQQISIDELNSICLKCPRDGKSHNLAQCPQVQVFRKAPTMNQNT